jgi:hypothetical protein
METHIKGVGNRENAQQYQQDDGGRRLNPIGMPVDQVETANVIPVVF